MFLTFWYPSQLKHLVLRAFLAGNLPKKLSKVGVLDERGMKKSKKHHAIAPIKNKSTFTVFLGWICRKCCVLQCFERIFAQQLLRRLSEAVDVWVSSGGALGGPGRALGGSIYIYRKKLPINRPSGRYANIGDTTNKNIPVYSQSVDTMYLLNQLLSICLYAFQ